MIALTAASMSNRIKRKTLDEAEIIRECEAIKALGFEHLLLVTGEHQTKVGMDYFRRHLPTIRSRFSSLMMEVQPLAEDEYTELKALGLDGVMVYQETYHPATYQQHHLRVISRIFTGGWQPQIVWAVRDRQDRIRCLDWLVQ